MFLDLAARALLMPVLLGQALYLRVRVIKMPEPAGARSGVTGNGPPVKLLILGDSSAAGVGVDTQQEALLGQIIARLSGQASVTYDLVAVTGARTIDVLGWLDDLPDNHYDVVVTALGVNDVTKGVSLRRWLQLQAKLFDRLGAKFGAQRIIVSSLPPVEQFPLLPHPLRWVLGRQAARFDHNLHELVDQRTDCVAVKIDLGLDQSNMAIDGFHPGPTVYAAWAEEVVRLIKHETDLLDGAQATP